MSVSELRVLYIPQCALPYLGSVFEVVAPVPEQRKTSTYRLHCEAAGVCDDVGTLLPQHQADLWESATGLIVSLLYQNVAHLRS